MTPRGGVLVALTAAAVTFIGLIPRLLLAADALPAWLRPFIWSDPLHTWERGLSGGRFPYWDTFFEYPPLTGYLSALLAAISGSALTYVALWGILQIAAAALIAALIARELPSRPLRWALAPQLALFGPLNFDLLPVAALVGAVALERRARRRTATVALAAGAALKIFPGIALPVTVLRRIAAGEPRQALVSVALFGALVAALYAPTLGAPYSSGYSFERYAAGPIHNLDSVWGLASGVLAAFLEESDVALVVLVLSTAGLVVTYVAVVVPASLRARDPAVPIASALLTLLLWSRLYSPQFSLWVLPFLALLPLRAWAVFALVAADGIVFLTVYPLTLVQWVPSDTLPVVLLGALGAAVAARHVVLVAMWREVSKAAR